MKICNLHSFGPYGNLRDKKVLHFIGCPLVKFQLTYFGVVTGVGHVL